MTGLNVEKYLEIVESFSGLQSTADIQSQCNVTAVAFGFDNFIFGSFFPQVGDLVTVDGFPQEWRNRYLEDRYLDIDPTVLHAMVETAPLYWKDIKRERTVAGRATSAMMDEAAGFGLRDGITIPVHGPGAEAGLMSFSSNGQMPGVAGSEPLLQAVSHYAHESLKKVVVGDERTKDALTSRECECLKWTAVGKTSWEISKILSVSESTVIFHLKNAIKKMGVSNRPQAVARAVALAKIKLF